MERASLRILLLALLAGGLAGGLAAGKAAATTYVMVSDAELTAQAELIAEVEVLRTTAAVQAELPATDYEVAMLRVLKGEAGAPAIVAPTITVPTILVRVPGGVSPQGIGYRVWGAPVFVPGERAILFLRAAPDGTYRILHLLLGAFHEVALAGRRLAVRDLSGASEARLDASGELALDHRPIDLPRDYDAFARWVADGGRGSAGYFLHDKDGGLEEAIDKFTFLTGGDGVRIRWFEFQAGGTIGWQADSRGLPGLAGGGFTELERALAAWTNDPASTVRYAWTGTTGSIATGCSAPAGVGKVVFEDPAGEVEGSFDCDSGVLAQGGPCYQLSLIPYRGVNYHPAVNAHIVTNDGLACFFQQSASPAKAAEELLAHELGHTLGFGHSSTGQALMFAFIHDDGRGAQLHADDRAALAEAYGDGTVPPPPPPPTLPSAPSQLTATALSSSQIRLTWRDNASNETGYRVERRGYAGFVEIASLAAGSTSYTATGLAPATPYDFRVRAVNGQGSSAYSNVAAAVSLGVIGPCVPGGTTLCLLTGKVRVEVDWKNQHAGGALGSGHAAPIGARSGSFWFFAPDNVELLVKALDGGPINGHYWFFYGALSDVEYWVRVTQTATGEVAVYHNPPGEICGAGDTGALDKAGGFASSGLGLLDGAAPALAKLSPAGPCTPGPETLCLLGNRFEVKVSWRDHRNGTSGTGKRVAVSDRSGYFWFFTADNLELTVKALDGRGQNGHFWFFYGALSDVEYTITVRDTVTGSTRTYSNPAGEICGVGDTSAF